MKYEASNEAGQYTQIEAYRKSLIGLYIFKAVTAKVIEHNATSAKCVYRRDYLVLSGVQNNDRVTCSGLK